MKALDVVFWVFFGGGILFIVIIWIRLGLESWRARPRGWSGGGPSGTGGITGSHDASTAFASSDLSASDFSTDVSASEAGGSDSGGGGDFSGGGGESGGGGSSGSWS